MIIDNEEIFFIDNPRDLDTSLVYVPLRRFLGIVPRGIVAQLKSVNSLESAKMIAEVRNNPLVKLNCYNSLFDNNNRLHLNLTDGCQLKCTYCYNESCSSGKQTTLSFSEAKSIINSYTVISLEHGVDILKFALFGGSEPTFDADLFKKVVHYIKQVCTDNNKKYSLTMTTNGYYPTDLMMFIIENFTSVTLSIDGYKTLHDSQRKNWNNHGSYDLVFRNAILLRDSSISHSFRVTVTRNTLSYWKDVLDYFIKNFPSEKISFAPVLPIGRGTDIAQLIPNLDEWKNTAYKMYEYAKDKINIRFPGVESPDTLQLHYCGATNGKMWIVSKNGDVVTCAHDRTNNRIIIGKYDFDNHLFSINEDAINRLQESFASRNLPECQDCFCKYTCAGGCASYRLTGIIQNCEMIKKLTSLKFADFIACSSQKRD